jgi:hypothetical protein
MWNDPEIRLLVDERRNRNVEYWEIAGCNSKVAFWTSVVGIINSKFRKIYTAQQCKEKFQNLVREYKVRKITKCCDRNLTLWFYFFFQLVDEEASKKREVEDFQRTEKNISMNLLMTSGKGQVTYMKIFFFF